MPSIDTRERVVHWRRLLLGGLLLIALTAGVGAALELWWFGLSDATAARRVERDVTQRFEAMVQAIAAASARVGTDARAVAGLGADPEGGDRALFDVVAEARRTSARPAVIAITVYDKAPAARAWAGAPSDIPDQRISGPSTFFITPSPLGLRLVHLQPIVSSEGSRLGAVASEHVISPAAAATTLTPADYTLQTGLGPASLRTRFEGAGDLARPGAVVLRAPTGEPLAEAWVDPRTLAAARHAWRRQVGAVMLALLGATLLLLIGPLLDRRIRGSRDAYVRATSGAMVLTALGGLVLWIALATGANRLPSTPATLLLAGGTLAALVSLLAGPISRLRLASRQRTLFMQGLTVPLVATALASGLGVAALIVGFYRLLDLVTDPVSIDLRHFSLHPWSQRRITLLTGIVAMQLAVLWAGALLSVATAARWRIPRRALPRRLAIVALWMAPAVVAAIVVTALELPIAALGLVLSAAACALTADAAPRIATWYRRTTVAARILALFLAFLIPTLLLYPAMSFFAERATRELIATQYAVQAQNHVETLLRSTEQARKEVDGLDALPELVAEERPPDTSPDSGAAFLVWQQTVLARERLTSAVELYDRAGTLVSRFALNVPEYTATTLQSSAGCGWDVFGEVSPFGAEERRMLHAERRICVVDASGVPQPQGAIILHVLLDETLPFMTSQNPYFEVVRAEASAKEGTAGGNVEVAIYSWGLQPVYTSGRSAWPITDALFASIYASRDPFWAEIEAGGDRHQVYFSNDRERIFAIGYPMLTVFDHFVHVAELTTFAGAAFAIVLIGTAIFTRVARQRPRVGRALLREIRASFYRKLFLAFVLAAIIPVLTLALVIRTYFANLLQADVEAEAARTAAVAQRVIQDLDIGLRRTSEPTATLSDDWMVWISQVIDQDVNVFRGAELVATSERALFASGVLPTRTPDDVYREIVLERLPSFVREDAIGTFSYMLAAAPVRAAGPDVLLTVPLTLRQREIEREIDELDRGVHLAALFFVLLGAAIGLSMAERIADPVRRLTRATGRIARGDFDARIAVRSADELRRLVDAFNSMAAELKAQRAQLERTHRLEAWAEMARQVAHEIKNPLTPIQLSAEHLQRVHVDRGEPMGPVLENCVSSILGQVRLLRQISSEFSSFASSPTARVAPVSLPELVAEVVDPYRTGLQGRIEIENQVPAALPLVLVDRTLTARAFSNIVENALHAMPGPGRLRIEAVVDADGVRLEVTDTGVGMDQEALDRVFEPYFSTKASGTGLGLPIARRNIELNGGSVDVRSTKGVGTTVVVKLPLAGGPSA